MNRNTAIVALIVIVALTLGAVAFFKNYSYSPTPAPDTSAADGQAVLATITQFGQAMQNVTTSGDTNTARQAVKTNYQGYLAPELLAKWTQDPTLAPGRFNSNPWPDHVNITTMEKTAYGYRVDGALVENTNHSYPVEIELQKIGSSWRITSFATVATTTTP